MPVSPARVEFENEALFLGGDAAVLEVGVEVVDPAEAATLPGPIQTYNKVNGERRRRKGLISMEHGRGSDASG